MGICLVNLLNLLKTIEHLHFKRHGRVSALKCMRETALITMKYKIKYWIKYNINYTLILIITIVILMLFKK